MQKFASYKTVDQIQQACREAGFPFNRAAYDRGSDFVRFGFAHGEQRFTVAYSSFNGKFIGICADSDAVFTESSTELDDAPWYQALLNFVYVPMQEG